MNWIRIIALLLIFYSCSEPEAEVGKRAIARVFDVFLYEEDLEGIVPDGVLPKDSIDLTAGFVDDWIKTQLLIKKAEMNLSAEQKDVEQRLREYRENLLIFKYRDKLIKQKLDTVILEHQIGEYYNKSSSGFKLGMNVVKAIFVKIPSSSSAKFRIRHWYMKADKASIAKLQEYCENNNGEYQDNNGDWMSFSELLKKIPTRISSQGKLLRTKRFFELDDSTDNYFVNILEYKLKNDISPLVFVRGNIKEILLKKRRKALIDSVENALFNNAFKNKNFEIFGNETNK